MPRDTICDLSEHQTLKDELPKVAFEKEKRHKTSYIGQLYVNYYTGVVRQNGLCLSDQE